MPIPFPDSIRPKTVYQVYIEWDHEDCDVALKVNKAIDKLKRPEGLWHTDQLGGACWNAYIQINGPHFQHVKDFSEKVLRLMKRSGCDLYALDVG
jgi:hypothetical protein